MEIISEGMPATAPAPQYLPRFADGTINLQELIRSMAEMLTNEIMSAEADQLCVRPHLVERDRLVQARKEAPGVEGVSGRLHRVEEWEEMTAATAAGAARGRARVGASRRKELEDDHDQEH